MSLAAFRQGTPGVYFGIPSEEYHGHPAISHSRLRKIRRTPAHYQYDITQPPEPTKPEQLIGTLTHHLILEPEREFPGVAIKPKGMSFATTEGKEWRKAQATKTIVGEEDWQSVRNMALAVTGHPVFQLLEEGSQWEVSVLALRDSFADSPALCKVRMDMFPANDALVDIKTTTDASDYAFSKSIYDFGYNSQAAWYLDTWNLANPNNPRNEFLIFAVEKQPPHLVAVYRVVPEAIEAGRFANQRRLESLVTCQQTKVWPGYSPGIIDIGIPQWALKRNESSPLLEEFF